MRALKARTLTPVLAVPALSHINWRPSKSCCIVHRRQVSSKEMRWRWKLECTSSLLFIIVSFTHVSPSGTSVKSRTGSATSAKPLASGPSGPVFLFLAPPEVVDINTTSHAKPHRVHLPKRKRKMMRWIWMTRTRWNSMWTSAAKKTSRKR